MNENRDELAFKKVVEILQILDRSAQYLYIDNYHDQLQFIYDILINSIAFFLIKTSSSESIDTMLNHVIENLKEAVSHNKENKNDTRRIYKQ